MNPDIQLLMDTFKVSEDNAKLMLVNGFNIDVLKFGLVDSYVNDKLSAESDKIVDKYSKVLENIVKTDI